jgi:uncharacterized membrane protein
MKTFIRLKNFATTTLIGGLAAILPLGIIIILFRWVINLIEKYLRPLVNLLNPETMLGRILTYTMAVAAIILLFFLVGLIVKTSFGNMLRNHIEHVYLSKIPGYKTARDIVKQLFGGQKSFFSEVVLVDVYGTGVLSTGFITDHCGDYKTVFVPTGPNPTTGYVFHVPKNKVIKSDVPVETAIRSIIGCGAGSSEVFAKTDLTKREE